jgi:Holliday junction resolvase RusA-like endonuclease
MPLPIFDIDAMIADNGAPQDTTVYIDIKGEPMVQERHRVRVVRPGGRTIVYDPSHNKKRACKEALEKALAGLGITQFPVFPGNNLKFFVKMEFHLHNASKDNDNIEKFYMDMMESVIYFNDRQIFENIGKKRLVAKGEEFTKIEVYELVGLEN